MRALAGVYVALVGVGAVFIHLRSDATFDYHALRPLQLNHRLQEGDLRSPEVTWALASTVRDKSTYANRYLDRRVASGAPVKYEYLKDRPTARPVAGTEAYPWFLREPERHWASLLDVGWTVDLCADTTCPVMEAPVLAVDCGSRDNSNCAAIIQLTAMQKTALGSAHK